MSVEESLRQIAKSLRQLYEMPMTNDSELQAWNKLAHLFRNDLYGKFADISDKLPHLIEHYLSDADIRIKDLKYKENQEAKINEIIIAFEKGEIPDSDI